MCLCGYIRNHALLYFRALPELAFVNPQVIVCFFHQRKLQETFRRMALHISLEFETSSFYIQV